MPLEVQARATVAVLDTGVMDNHPDLRNQIAYFAATNYCRETGGPSQTPSYPKYTLWIDFDHLNPQNPCTPAPNVLYEAHGTHVSGTVAAAFGGGRVVGVAPGVRLAAYKVFDRYHYTDPETGEEYDDVGAWDGPIFEAIVDAANRGFDVINMSLGGTLDTRSREDVAAMVAWDRVMKYANRKGTVIVASAGNSAENATAPWCTSLPTCPRWSPSPPRARPAPFGATPILPRIPSTPSPAKTSSPSIPITELR